MCILFLVCLICFTLGRGTNTGQALEVTQNNVLEPALANPLSDLETVQVILHGPFHSFIRSSIRPFVLSFVDFFILNLQDKQASHSAISF